MSDSSSKFFDIDYESESVLRKTDLDAKIEMAKSGGDWWLSSGEEEKIREQLFQDGRGGLVADVIIGQINQARFRQYTGIQSEPEMAVRDPISEAWLHLRKC